MLADDQEVANYMIDLGDLLETVGDRVGGEDRRWASCDTLLLCPLQVVLDPIRVRLHVEDTDCFARIDADAYGDEEALAGRFIVREAPGVLAGACAVRFPLTTATPASVVHIVLFS